MTRLEMINEIAQNPDKMFKDGRGNTYFKGLYVGGKEKDSLYGATAFGDYFCSQAGVFDDLDIYVEVE